jgi:hypothetical protein
MSSCHQSWGSPYLCRDFGVAQAEATPLQPLDHQLLLLCDIYGLLKRIMRLRKSSLGFNQSALVNHGSMCGIEVVITYSLAVGMGSAGIAVDVWQI